VTATLDGAKRYRENYRAEIDSAALYEACAASEERQPIAEVYRRLAAAERTHADVWQQRLRGIGAEPPPLPSWRARTLIWLVRRFGAGIVLPTLMEGEAKDSRSYARQSGDAPPTIAGEESAHRRLLSAIRDTTRAGMKGTSIASLEGRHRAVGGNALRAAVLGANDGLVSNLSLVMGVAGAELSPRSILITGLAGLLAGAGSMALGEWLSVQSSRELFQRQLDIERAELESDPAAEVEELALIYRAKGLAEEQARTLAAQVMASPDTALDTLAREELAIDPAELGGSAWVAAGTSFLLFAIGAIIPVLPFFALSGAAGVVVSVASSAVALFILGAAITIMTGRPALSSGMRQLAFGLAAAGLTYLVGHLIGVGVMP
jgi:VIT1/CCC1 family predicted Fe2+/Mn2+ transporter